MQKLILYIEASDPTSANNETAGYAIGHYWRNSVTGTLYYHQSDGVWQRLPSTVFVQTSDQTATSVEETSLIGGSSVGSKIILANTLTIGRTYRVKLKGYASGVQGATGTLKVYFGNDALVTSAATWSSLTDVMFDVEFEFTCRTIGQTGSLIGEGRSFVSGGQGFATVAMRPLLMLTPITIDTTINNAIDITYAWSDVNAGNSVKVTTAIIEVLN